MIAIKGLIRNISGIYNSTISPESAIKLGASLASIINSNGIYIVNSDQYNLSKSIKHSIISGILSTGSLVVDIDDSTFPMCRFGVRHIIADGGVHIRRDGMNMDLVHIELIKDKGSNLDKGMVRKIENTMILEDYKRPHGGEIGDIVHINNFSAIYLKEGIKRLKNISRIKREKPTIAIASPSDNIISLAEKYLKKIGCLVKGIEGRAFTVEDLKYLVLDENLTLGIFYSEDGERIALTDGYNIVEDEKYYLLSILIGFKSGELTQAIVPYNFPRKVERLAEKYRGNIIYTKSNISDLITTMCERNLEFQLMLNFDGIWASGKIIDYLVGNNMVLNRLLQELPEYFYLKKEIPCKWKDKSNIIRRLVDSNIGEAESKEGIKFTDDKGWVLLIPDEEEPRFNLYIEGYDEEYAEELWTKYQDKIGKLLKE